MSKSFGPVAAVRDIDLSICRGEIFSLLGPSGCGKTTLLRIVAGFETPSTGRVLIDGIDMTGIPPWRRPVNMMFQSYALFPHMSAADNIAFGLRQEGLPRPAIRERVRDMLALVRLEGLERRKPDQLSGGQRQRVALARALAKLPKALLLDEPLGALDRRLREEMQFELVRIQETLGITFLVVTHDQEEAMTLSTRIGVMQDGRLLQTGAPNDIYENPANRAVASFIGSVNLFDGVLVESGPGHARIQSAEAGCAIRVDRPVPAPEGAVCTIALRPEKIVLSRTMPPPVPHRANLTRGRVDEIAYLGMLSIYQVVLETGKIVRVGLPNPRRTGSDAPTRGEEVWLTWHPSSPVVLLS